MSDVVMGAHALHGLVGGRGPDGEGFVIVTPRHDGSFSVSSEADRPFGVAFSDDGTRMFVLDNTDEDVHQYELSTAWMESTLGPEGDGPEYPERTVEWYEDDGSTVRESVVYTLSYDGDGDLVEETAQ